LPCEGGLIPKILSAENVLLMFTIALGFDVGAVKKNNSPFAVLITLGFTRDIPQDPMSSSAEVTQVLSYWKILHGSTYDVCRLQCRSMTAYNPFASNLYQCLSQNAHCLPTSCCPLFCLYRIPTLLSIPRVPHIIHTSKTKTQDPNKLISENWKVQYSATAAPSG